jgi:pimeloyl-ACP methyl ester carboxylesterase
VEVTTGFVTVGKANLFYAMMGAGQPLLLLHAGIADHRMWAQQFREFSKHFQVIAPDFRGYGKSTVPNEPFNHWEDIHGIMQYLKLKSVNIVGCSLGGKVGIELAIAYPHMVNRLILVAPGLAGYEYWDKETLEKDAILEELIASRRREEVADMVVDIWVVGLKREEKTVDSSTRAVVRQMILDNYRSVTDEFSERTAQFDVISRLGEIQAPTLVLIGDSDLPDMHAISHLVADKIPHAKRETILSSAHLPNLEQNKLFNQLVVGFLATK